MLSSNRIKDERRCFRVGKRNKKEKQEKQERNETEQDGKGGLILQTPGYVIP